MLGTLCDIFPFKQKLEMEQITMKCEKIKILPWKSRVNKTEFGGKSYNLSIVSQNNIKVPYGIYISKHLWEILTSNGKHEARNLPTDIENCIKSKIEDFIAEMVIIRSSGLIEDDYEHSFAGIFESVIVPNNWAEIKDGIIKVLNSTFSKRAEVYSKQFNLSFPVPMAVIIQEAIAADFSGVTFTLDPYGKEYLLIEVIPGIGVPLVSGKVTPDRYYLSRSNLEVVDKHTSIKEFGLWIEGKQLIKKEIQPQEFPLNIIRKIARLSLHIEYIFDKPQDIEWCVKDNEIYILQSRPITMIISDRLEKTRLRKQHEKDETPYLKGIPGSPGVVFGKAYVVERSFNFSIDKSGIILVAPMTDPDMVPEIVKAAGIVTDRGGVISHAAIIARELGIPCTVGTGNATQLIKTEDELKVDGNKGFVWILNKGRYSGQDNKTYKKETFRIYGQEVPIRILNVVREGPLVSEIWHFPWEKTYKGPLKFIPLRPEIIASPLTQSIVIPAIESIPYVLELGNREIITTLYRGSIHLEYEYFKQIFEALRNRLIIKHDFFFMSDYMDSIKHSYKQIDQASKALLKAISKINELSAERVLPPLFKWWEIHNDFFARTYLMQAIGDDIVWPYIIRYLHSYLGEDKTSNIMSLLLNPTEISLSLQLLKEAFSIVDTLPEHYRALIRSNMSDEDLLKIIKNLPENKIFEKKLREFTRKWGWMRTRDFYFSSLNNQDTMLSFLRKTIFSSERNVSIDIKSNSKEFNTLIRDLQEILPKEVLKLIQYGRFLNHHRNEHFYIWIKNTDIVIKYFRAIASLFKKNRILDQKRDIFFLFAWEIIEIIRDPRNFDQVKPHIVSRKYHFMEGNKLLPTDVGLYDLKNRKVREEDGYWK